MSVGLELAEKFREKISSDFSKNHKQALGQYLTPAELAIFAVKFFDLNKFPCIKLLDPGAGTGSLTCSFIENFPIENINVKAVELDNKILPYLSDALSHYNFVEIINEDFIEFGIKSILQGDKYTHIFTNPPYIKVNKNFIESKVGKTCFDSHNLYSIFLEISIELLEDNGEIVAIIPRSFCNGKLFSKFRSKLLDRCSVEKIHLFLERDDVFKDDKVLQENIIIHLIRKKQSDAVEISHSHGISLKNFEKYSVPFNRVIFENDKNRVIHIPLSSSSLAIFNFKYSFKDLKIDISTGPIVDFRSIDKLSEIYGESYIPLIYTNHLKDFNLNWVDGLHKKKSFIKIDNAFKSYFKEGYYVAIRRFSSKEQDRRIHAYLVDTSIIGYTKGVTFENHLNVMHCNKSSLDFLLAKGLVIYLSSTLVDEYVRQFSGSTQINVTDLKYIPYPSKDVLINLGKLWDGTSYLSQNEIDYFLSTINVMG